MKKKLLLSIFGLVTVSSFGQGVIRLDNYNTSGPSITYGAGFGGLTGRGLGTGWTMGLYWALGDVTGSVAADPAGFADPTILGGGLTLGTGLGSTTAIGYWIPGQGYSGSAFVVSGTASAGGDLITLMITAYNGVDYASSVNRGHSAAFTLTTSANSSPSPVITGTAMPAFSIYLIPEPSTIIFACLGGSAWLFFHRRRSQKVASDVVQTRTNNQLGDRS